MNETNGHASPAVRRQIGQQFRPPGMARETAELLDVGPFVPPLPIHADARAPVQSVTAHGRSGLKTHQGYATAWIIDVRLEMPLGANAVGHAARDQNYARFFF